MKLYNTKKERHLLGLIIKNPNFLLGKPKISEDTFFNENHKKIFSNINSFSTLKTIDTALMKKEWYKKLGGVSYLIDCINDTLYTTMLDYILLVRELNDLHTARELYVISEKTKEQIGKKENEDIISEIAKKIKLIQKGETTQDIDELKDFNDIYGDEMGIRTGLTLLDDYLGGLKKENLIIIGARPAGGKSSCAGTIAVNTSKEHNVLFFNLEMSSKEMKRKFVSIKSGVPTDTILKQTFSTYEKEKIETASNELKTSKLKLVSPDKKLTTTQIERIATRAQDKYGLDLILIDYLNYIQPDEKGLQRTYQVEQRVQDLKLLSKQLNIPVVLLVQLNRDIDKRNIVVNSPPFLSDIKDSGSIEQEADAVVLLHRDRKHEDLVEMYVRKNRHGRTGNFTLSFRKETGKFNNIVPDKAVNDDLGL